MSMKPKNIENIYQFICSLTNGKTVCSCCRELRDWVEVYRKKNGELVSICSKCMHFIEKMLEDIQNEQDV